MAGFFALAALAWYLKPLAGVVSDSMPLFGTRRRSYLLLSALLGGACWLLMAVVGQQYAPLLCAAIAINTALVTASTVLGGLLVEQGQATRATGRLSTMRFVAWIGGALVASPVAGYLAQRPFGQTCALNAAALFLLAPIVLLLLTEERQPVSPTSGREAARRALKEQWEILRRSRPLCLVALFQFCFSIAPGFSTPLYYYQTNTDHFSNPFIGWLGVASCAAGVIGALVYGYLCRRLPMRAMLVGSTVAYGLSALGYLHYHTHADACMVESIYGFTGGLTTVLAFDMAARVAPHRSEALSYSLVMAASNLASAISDVIGSYLNGAWHIAFTWLVPINAATTLLVLVLIPLLPSSLLSGKDGDRPG